MSDDYQYRILEAIEANGERLDAIIDLLREIAGKDDGDEYVDEWAKANCIYCKQHVPHKYHTEKEDRA